MDETVEEKKASFDEEFKKLNPYLIFYIIIIYTHDVIIYYHIVYYYILLDIIMFSMKIIIIILFKIYFIKRLTPNTTGTENYHLYWVRQSFLVIRLDYRRFDEENLFSAWGGKGFFILFLRTRLTSKMLYWVISHSHNVQ